MSMTRLDVIKEALKHGGLSGVALLESLHQNGFAMDYLDMSVYADDTGKFKFNSDKNVWELV